MLSSTERNPNYCHVESVGGSKLDAVSIIVIKVQKTLLHLYLMLFICRTRR